MLKSLLKHCDLSLYEIKFFKTWGILISEKWKQVKFFSTNIVKDVYYKRILIKGFNKSEWMADMCKLLRLYVHAI